MLENSLFAILAFFLLLGGGMIVWSRLSVFSAFGFLLAMVAMSGLFALLHNSFLFLAQLLVSVGAVVVLTLIVVISADISEKDHPKEPLKGLYIAGTSLLVAPFGWMLYRTLALLEPLQKPLDGTYGTIDAMGNTLFESWVLPFELVSVLLLAAMLGAIVIGKKDLVRDA